MCIIKNVKSSLESPVEDALTDSKVMKQGHSCTQTPQKRDRGASIAIPPVHDVLQRGADQREKKAQKVQQDHESIDDPLISPLEHPPSHMIF